MILKIKNFLLKFLEKFPLIRFVLVFLFRKLKLSARVLNSDFPISNVEKIRGFKFPLLSKNENEGFYLRFQATPQNNLFFLNTFYQLIRSHIFSYEILPARRIKKKYEYFNKSAEEKIFALSHFSKHKQKFEINENDKNYQIYLEPDRYSYLNFTSDKVTIKSQNDFIISETFTKKTKVTKNKVILLIFIDGLSFLNDNNNFQEFAPNITNFFSKGKIFTNHYSNSEWTLPSFASIMTGKYTHNHGIFHPQANHDITQKNKILPEFFSENNYITFMCNSGWRSNPGYGYVKGFDKSIYKKEADSKFIINETIDQINAFKSFNNFVFMGINDLHHDLNLTPPLNLQINADPKLIYAKNSNEKVKSVNEKYNKNKIDILKHNISTLDQNLSILFNYLEKNFKDKFIVSLCTDHGHAFLGNDGDIISKSRTSIPFFLRTDIDSNREKLQFEEFGYTSNVDILPTILSLSEIKKNETTNNFDGNNILNREIQNDEILIESIYPMKKYEAKLINAKNIITCDIKNQINYDGNIILEEKEKQIFKSSKFLEFINIWNRNHILTNKDF